MIPLFKAFFFMSLFSFFLSCDPDDPSLSLEKKSQKKSLGLASKYELVTEETPENFKVAFLGDSGKGLGFERVLELVKKQGAQMVLHLGTLVLEDTG